MAKRKQLFEVDANNNISNTSINRANKKNTLFEVSAKGKVTSHDTSKEKNKNGFFQSSKYFDDGYDFGDVLKTTFWSGADLLQDVTRGFSRTIEGTTDTLGYLSADVLDFFGADDTADWLRDVSKYDVTGKLLKPSDYLEQRSVFGNYSDTVFEGVGNVGGMIVTNTVMPGSGATSTMLTSFSSAYGNSMSEALRNGQDLSTARKTAFIHGTAEAISEQFFSGLPILKTENWGGKVVGKVGSFIEHYFGTNTGKLAMKILNTTGEGFEEIISNMLVSVGNDIMHWRDKNFTYGMEGQTGNIGKDLLKSMTSKDSWEQFLSASLTSALTNGGNQFISNTQKNNLIKTYAKENNMTVNQAKNMFNQSVQQKTQTEMQRKPNMNLGQRVETENMAKAKTMQELRRGTFVQPGTETQTYQYAKSENQKVNEMNQSIVDAGGNNTQANREAAATAKRLIEDLGFNIKFTNNQQLQEQGQNVNGRNINGFVKDGTMYLNLDSDELANFTIGHETKHFFEANKEMNDLLNQSLKEYAQEKGIWDKRLAETTELYTDKDGNLIGDPEGELLADLTGEVFANYEFVNNLSVKNPSLFEKVRSFFQNLYYKATGQKEKLLIKQINDNLNKVYREYAKTQPKQEGTQYSLKASEKLNELANQSTSSEEYEGLRKSFIKDNTTYNETEKNGIYTIKANIDGDYVGSVNYTIDNGTPKVGMIYVDKDFRRAGVATELYKQLQEKFPNKEIVFGDLTEDGKKLLNKIGEYRKEVDKDGYDSYVGKIKESLKTEYNVENKDATLSKDRLDNIISESVSKWDNNYAQDYITTITPDQFLALTTNERTMQRLEQEVQELNVEDLKNEIQNIYLRVDLETGEVMGHEGRHRMLALKKAGIENVEIVVYPAYGTYDKYNAPQFDSMNLIGQDFGDTKGQDTQIGEMIPVSKANENKIRNGLKTDSKIQYSLSQELDDYLDKNKFTLDTNGNMSFENLTSKQITALASIYRKTGYSDVSSEYLKNKLSTFNGLKVPREVADRFIQQELGYKPKIDTTKVYEDAEGNPLTKEQVEFYKDSDVRDIRGRLIPVYHRTNAEFTVFDKKAGKQHGNKYGKGFYFSITPENYGNNEMKVYLNAKEGEYKYIPSQGYYVVQEPNQIKNVDNTNPTDSSDIRYSLSEDNEKVTATVNGEYKTYDSYYDYAKDTYKLNPNQTLEKELLYKYYTHEFKIPTNDSETSFYHGTDSVSNYDDFKVMDFDEHTMDRNYGDYFYITPDKDFANTYGREIAQFIIPNDKVLSLEEYRKSNKSDNELFKDYWAIEMPDGEYIVNDTKPMIEYSKQKAKEYIDYRESQNNQTLSQDNKGRELTKEQQEYFKGSKVRDENGNLMEVYHGTTSGGFNIFDSSKLGSTTQALDSKLGFHFTDNLGLGEMFADEKIAEGLSFNKGNKSELKSVYLNMVKPLDLNNLKYLKNIDENETFDKDLYYIVTGEKIDNQDQLDDIKEELKYNSQWNNTERVKDEIANTKGAKERIIELGYDGIIQRIQENDIMALEEYGEDDFEGNEYIVFNSNQIKNIDNLNPTESPDIRYSLSKNEDSYLDELSEQQMEYFKDTKAVDKQGYLDVVFHGTPKDFTVFDISQADNVALGNGLYFTTSEGNAKSYAKGTDGTEGKVLEGYVNIVNPASRTEKTLTFDNFKKLYNELNNNTEMYDEEMGMSNINALLSDYGNVYEENIDNILRKFYDSYDNDVSLIDNLSYIANAKEMYKTLRDVTGLDGIIAENPTGFDDKETYYIIFNPDQFKLKSNKTPTTNEDIRYSISQEGELQSNKYKDLFPGMTRSNIHLSDLKRKEIELPIEEENALKTSENEQKEGVEKPTRREVIDRNRQLAREQLGDITGIKDKKRGILYQINTMKRNLRDIMSKEQAQKMYDTYFKDITTNNAKIENDITSYNERIQKYNLNDKESTYTQMIGELKHNPETTLTQQQVDDFYYKNANKIDQQKCENAVNEFRQIYDELIERVNDVLTDNGYKPIEYRKGYFPHFIEEKATSKLGKLAEKLGWKVKKGQLPTDIAGITDQFKPGKAWTSFSQQRTGDATDYNALKGLDNYLRGAMDVIYHTNDIQKLRALENEIRYQYSSKGIQEKINEIYADDKLDMDEKNEAIANLTSNIRESGLGNFVTEIRNYTDNLANKKAFGDRSMEQTLGRDVYSIMNNINGRVSANMVGANISSAITNFIPITQAWSQLSTKNLMRGMYESIKTSIKGDNFADRSTFLTNRTKQAERLYNTKMDKLTQKLGVPFEAIDSFTSNTIVRAKYYDNIAKGMSEQEAMSNADEFAKDVMAGRSKGDQPTIFNRKNPLFKLFTAFQLEVNNQYGYMFKDIPTNMADEAKRKLVGAFIKMFLGAWLYNEITEKFTGRRAAFDPIDMAVSDVKTLTNEDMDLGDKIQSIVKDTAQEVPFVSGLAGGGRLPIQGAIPYSNPLEMVTKTFEDIGNLDDPKKRKTAINNLKKEWSKPVYYLAFPVAGGQIKKTVEGLSMYDKDLPIAGSYTNSGKLRFEADTSTLGKVQAAVFGQYASKNAREYFKNGYTPLTEGQVEEALEAELPINEYREINQGIKDAKAEAKAKGENQTEAMYDYIYDLPIEMEQKNSLINSRTKGSSTVKDKNGYIKYVDDKGKTYWYDKKNDIVYNSKYKEMDTKDIADLTKASTQKDISNYGDYGSLAEFNYSNKNPEKYLALTKIADYDTFMEYKDELAAIKQKYDNQPTEFKKKKVFEYINSLPLSVEQKLMLQKMGAGYSIKQYRGRLHNYINNMELTKEQKQAIDKVLFD